MWICLPRKLPRFSDTAKAPGAITGNLEKPRPPLGERNVQEPGADPQRWADGLWDSDCPQSSPQPCPPSEAGDRGKVEGKKTLIKFVFNLNRRMKNN